MWQVNITSNQDHPPIQKQPVALNTLSITTNPELVQWYHATLFSPLHKTLLQAIKKVHFYIWTNLTVDLTKHPLLFMVTRKGQMKQIQKNINYTKTPETNPIEGEPMETLDTQYNQVFTKIIDPQQRIETNLAGRFPVISNLVNKIHICPLGV